MLIRDKINMTKSKDNVRDSLLDYKHHNVYCMTIFDGIK